MNMQVNSTNAIHSVPLQGLDIESALMAVQSKRAELLETQLKGQLEEVQARNLQIAKLNQTLSAARTLGANFKSDAKSTSKINDMVKDARTPAVKSFDDAVWAIAKKNPEIAQQIRDGFKNGTFNNSADVVNAFPKKIDYFLNNIINLQELWGPASKDYANGIANPRADQLNALTDSWKSAGLGEFNLQNKGELDSQIENIKSMIDTLSNSQQMDMLRLQSLSNKRNEAFDLMTNFIKKMQDNRSSIVNSIR